MFHILELLVPFVGVVGLHTLLGFLMPLNFPYLYLQLVLQLSSLQSLPLDLTHVVLLLYFALGQARL